MRMFLLSYAALICVRKEPYLPRRDNNKCFSFLRLHFENSCNIVLKSDVKIFTLYRETKINVCFGRSFYRTNILYFHTPFNGHILWKIVKGPTEMKIQGAFFNCSSPFSVPKWKNLLSQRGAFLHWKFREKLVLVGCNLFFILVLKIGRNS